MILFTKTQTNRFALIIFSTRVGKAYTRKYPSMITNDYGRSSPDRTGNLRVTIGQN